MKHTIRRVLPVLMAAVMMMTLMLPVLAGEDAPELNLPVTIRLAGDYPQNERYTIVLKADDAANPMPAESENGRCEMTITGAGTESFPTIVYNRVGVYSYQVWQKPGSNPDCEYDDTIYHVTVYITNDEENGGLNITVVAYADGNSEEKTEIIFKNYYEYDPIIPPPETKPDETEPPETRPDETEPPETEPDETEPPETEPVETEPVETEPPETEPPETEPEVIETEPEEPEEILVQTGQLNWPISVLSVGGMGCLALGCVFLTGNRKKEDETEEEFEESLEDVVEEDNDKEETDGE